MSDTSINLEQQNIWLKELIKQRNRTIAELIEENNYLRIENDILTTGDTREQIGRLLKLLGGDEITEQHYEEMRLAIEYQAAGLPGGEGRKVFAQRVGVSDRTLRGYVTKWQKSASKNE